MKKYFWMALVAIVPFAFASCSDSDSDNGGSSSKTTIVKKSTANAKKMTSFTPSEGLSEADLERLPLDGEFKPSDDATTGDALLHFGTKSEAAKSRGELSGIWEKEWYFGKYEIIATGKYKVPGYGVITIKGEGIGKKQFEIQIDGIDGIFNGDVNLANYDAITDETAGWLAQKWVITKTVLEVTGAVKNPVGAIYEGANASNLEYIANDLATKHDIEIDAETLKDLKTIEMIDFQVSGTMQVTYGNKVYAIGDWRWKDVGKSFSYTLRDKDMGNDIITASGTGKVQFNGNDCDLTIAADFTNKSKTYHAETTFTLKLK